ncbi:MAG: MFS transporter [Anaerolineales bacterium]|nr:MFS transporter [Anaerolineales bacterium]
MKWYFVPRTTLDISLLFGARIARLFAYGFVSVVLVLYLTSVGLGTIQVGALLTLTLAGDAVISLWLTTTADRFGRKRTLIIGAALMLGAGAVFVITRNPIALGLAAIIGVISPSGNEIGPFLSIEQAALSQLVPDNRRTHIFAWYNLAGSFATATGALCAGLIAQALQSSGWTPVDSYRAVLTGYALIGLLLLVAFLALSPAVEAPKAAAGRPVKLFLGLHKSRAIVFKLSALFALDAFAGGFVVQSIVAFWFSVRFAANIDTIGAIFFAANILAGISALLAARIAARFGLINTMVFTHIPSNILLMLVPFMPTLPIAVLVMLARFSISQMDVPTRQSYTMAVVAPDERSAAAGVTGIARSVGAAIAPAISGALLAGAMTFSAPFFIAGGLKIVYDLLLYRSFKATKPPEEAAPRQP